MSAETNNTRELEPALRYLAAHPDKQVEFIAGKFQVEGGKATIWAWLNTYNGGKKPLPAYRIDNALGKAAPATQAPAPKVAAAVKRPLVHMGPVVVVPGGPPPNTLAENLALIDDGKSPWEKAPRRPQRRTLYLFRTALEAMRDMKDFNEPKESGWWKFKKKWLGSSTPAPGKVGRFLAWYEEQFNKPTAPAKPKPFKFPVKVVQHTPGPLGRKVRALAGAGWQKLEIKSGRQVDYSIRYSGAATRNPTLAFTSSFVKSQPTLEAGTRFDIYFNALTGQLRLAIGDGTGLVARKEHGGLRMASRNFPSLLGKDSRRWLAPTKVEDPRDFVLEPVAAGKGDAT